MTRTSPLHIRTCIVTYTAGSVLAAALTGCTPPPGDAGGAPSGPTSASATFAYPSRGATTCTAQSTTWSATPVNLGAGAGDATKQSSSLGPASWPATGTDCQLTHGFTNLRPGTWQVSLTVDGAPVAVCSATLTPAGAHSLAMNGCTVL